MRRPILSLLLLCSGLVLTPLAASANDSMAELKTGGITYVRSDAVRMLREDLSISMDQIDVDYVFQNTTDADVESLVAFPMPDIVPVPYESEVAIPGKTDNFLGFRVWVGGKEVHPELSQRALAYGIDVTGELYGMGIPLMPLSRATQDALMRLPQDVHDDWIARGLIYDDVYDVGKGMVAHPTASWTLQQVYAWRMIFPAGRQVRVSHSYHPSVGGSTGLNFVYYSKENSELYDEYVDKYCIDQAFMNAALKRQLPDGGFAVWESWISYILTTGQNWYGPIGTFHLTIDKGSTKNLVSFCGTGVRKTGPTRFELTYKDYIPERELDILFLVSVN